MQSSAVSSTHFYENGVLILQLGLVLYGAQPMVSEALPLERSCLSSKDRQENGCTGMNKFLQEIVVAG